MNQKDYSKDINEIKNLMSRSSQFISLSGLSGILSGVIAIIGATIASMFILTGPDDFKMLRENSSAIPYLILLLAVVALLSFLIAVRLSKKRAEANQEKLWSPTSKRMLINFIVPLATGLGLIIINLSRGEYEMLVAFMLIFFGLALVNASKFTVGTIRYLGYSQIVVGLISALFPEYGFWLWIIGFGVFHIIYGIVLYQREKTETV